MQICNGITESFFFIFSKLFAVFDDFSKWRVPNVLQNLEKSSNIAKIVGKCRKSCNFYCYFNGCFWNQKCSQCNDASTFFSDQTLPDLCYKYRIKWQNFRTDLESLSSQAHCALKSDKKVQFEEVTSSRGLTQRLEIYKRFQNSEQGNS